MSNFQAPSQSSLTEEQCQENAAEECLDDIQEEPTFFTNTGGAAGETGGGVSLELHDEVSVSELGGGGSNNRSGHYLSN